MRTLIISGLIVALCGSVSAEPRARSSARGMRIGVVSANGMSRLFAGQSTRAAYGAMALRKTGRSGIKLVRGLNKLVADGSSFERALISPTHVALVPKTGAIEIFRRADVEAHLASGKAFAPSKVQVGIRARGFPINAEVGPGDTIFLYRQLPVKANGQIASTDGNTSFALGTEDAYHPFGTAGRTARIALPRAIFEKAVNGTSGAVGWNNYGDGYSTGLEVEREVQIPSNTIRELFH